ncbi:hypothetical protein B1H58_20605 (plasmid) [Pantoea alhagi]|uniref:HEPN domain-containing protein n=1 Tax=Pantoea alhagi TaxID=1891675 RepID=A0A1W6BBG3_9GAMM|nr:hypothetical protein [Pantoea alhagi]ARJ44420.1 hypothetical protein B1H58_20605 [Pantoea alhagi]
MDNEKDTPSSLLTNDTDWHNNACLNYMPDHSTAYTEGYRRAADILIHHINETGRNQDFLVYPIVFLYRHHIELLIKQTIKSALLLTAEPSKYTYKKDSHDLNALWLFARKRIMEVDERYKPSDFKKIDDVVSELHKVDGSATDFRYARHKDGTRSLETLSYINTRRFGERMQAASDVLDGIDEGLCYLIDLDNEMYAQCGTPEG